MLLRQPPHSKKVVSEVLEPTGICSLKAFVKSNSCEIRSGLQLACQLTSNVMNRVDFYGQDFVLCHAAIKKVFPWLLPFSFLRYSIIAETSFATRMGPQSFGYICLKGTHWSLFLQVLGTTSNSPDAAQHSLQLKKCQIFQIFCHS